MARSAVTSPRESSSQAMARSAIPSSPLNLGSTPDPHSNTPSSVVSVSSMPPERPIASTPQPTLFPELTVSTPEPAPFPELTEPAPSPELKESTL